MEKRMGMRADGSERKSSSRSDTERDHSQVETRPRQSVRAMITDLERRTFISSIADPEGKELAAKAFDKAKRTTEKTALIAYPTDPAEMALEDEKLLKEVQKRYDVSCTKATRFQEKAPQQAPKIGFPTGDRYTYYRIELTVKETPHSCYENIFAYNTEDNTAVVIGMRNFRTRPEGFDGTQPIDDEISYKGTQPLNFSQIKDGSVRFLQEKLKLEQPIGITRYIGTSITNSETLGLARHLGRALGKKGDEHYILKQGTAAFTAMLGTATNLSQNFFAAKYHRKITSIEVGERNERMLKSLVFHYA